MNITAEERIMYSVMKAVYDSGIPISFKGSMVLKACLFEAGFLDETRHTVDIDANWNTDIPPTAEQMVESLQRAINRGGMDYEVRLYRMYGEKRSAGFELVDRNTDEILFTMDVDVNRPITPTQIYEVDGICFRGVSPLQMIADKVAAVSTDKVFRRIKDVVDLYYISKVFEFDVQKIYSTLKCSERTMGDFQGFLQRKEDLLHSYEKFRFASGVNKPPFDAVYREVKIYLKDVLQIAKHCRLSGTYTACYSYKNHTVSFSVINAHHTSHSHTRCPPPWIPSCPLHHASLSPEA